jgi:hypothetical protein
MKETENERENKRMRELKAKGMRERAKSTRKQCSERVRE